MQTFAKYIMRGFFEAASGNPILFVEVLFWKTTADCYEITEGYGSLARERSVCLHTLTNTHIHYLIIITRDAKMRASMWTREQEEELAELYQQYQEEDGNHVQCNMYIAIRLVPLVCLSILLCKSIQETLRQVYRLYVCVCMSVYMYVCVFAYVCTCTCVCLRMCVHMCLLC